MMTLGIKAAVETIRMAVQEYESDTFSASGSKMTRSEVMAVVAKLIEDNVKPGENIDGIEIGAALDEVRGND